MTEDALDIEIAELKAQIKVARANRSPDLAGLLIRLGRRISTRNYREYLKAWLPTLGANNGGDSHV